MAGLLTMRPEKEAEGTRKRSLPHLLLAHGAGQGMRSPYFETLSQQLVANGVAVTRFEFGYMAIRGQDGKRRPPPRINLLIPEYHAAIEQLRDELAPGERIVIGGKSMGGRIASMMADELFETGEIAGLVCLGYPFHPPKKLTTLRTAHLERLQTPALILQGERDPFGTRSEVESYPLSDAIRVVWIGDGDHDLAPRVKSGLTREGNLATAAKAISAFLAKL